MENSQKPTDKKIVAIIKIFQSGGYPTDEEDEEMLHYLAKWYPGITDSIFHDKNQTTPEQILEMAKKKNKVIHL